MVSWTRITSARTKVDKEDSGLQLENSTTHRPQRMTEDTNGGRSLEELLIRHVYNYDLESHFL